MLRCLLMLTLLTAITACQQGSRGDTVAAPTPVAFSGRDAYEQICARCHEDGQDGAPRTGDPEAWAGRSALWEAVLFEHAQEGYLDMPPQDEGGAYPESMIAAAAEYLLEITHPDQPPD